MTIMETSKRKQRVEGAPAGEQYDCPGCGRLLILDDAQRQRAAIADRAAMETKRSKAKRGLL